MLKLKVLFLNDVRAHLMHIVPSMIFFLCSNIILCGSSSSKLPNRELLGLLTDDDGGCGDGGGGGARMREESRGMCGELHKYVGELIFFLR